MPATGRSSALSQAASHASPPPLRPWPAVLMRIRAHRALPRASPRISPGCTRSPSLRAQLRLTAGSTRANTACATHTPASTPGALARKVARAWVPSGTLRQAGRGAVTSARRQGAGGQRRVGVPGVGHVPRKALRGQVVRCMAANRPYGGPMAQDSTCGSDWHRRRTSRGWRRRHSHPHPLPARCQLQHKHRMLGAPGEPPAQSWLQLPPCKWRQPAAGSTRAAVAATPSCRANGGQPEKSMPCTICKHTNGQRRTARNSPVLAPLHCPGC